MLRDTGTDERQLTLREAKTCSRGVFDRLSRIARAAERECYARLGNRPGDHHLRDRSPVGGRHRFQHAHQSRDFLTVRLAEARVAVALVVVRKDPFRPDLAREKTERQL